MFYENQAHKVNLPKMGKCFMTIGGQSDWSRHCYWLSCLTYGQSRRHRGDLVPNPPQTMHQAPPNWNLKTINVWSFVNFHNVKTSTGKQKTHSNHNVGWYSPEISLTITSGDFHLGTTTPPLLSGWKSPEVSIPGVWVIVAENLNVINADKCSPSLAVCMWTSFCSVLMVDRFHSVVWSQSSCSQWNALAFYRKCTHNKSKPFLLKP